MSATPSPSSMAGLSPKHPQNFRGTSQSSLKGTCMKATVIAAAALTCGVPTLVGLTGVLSSHQVFALPHTLTWIASMGIGPQGLLLGVGVTGIAVLTALAIRSYRSKEHTSPAQDDSLALIAPTPSSDDTVVHISTQSPSTPTLTTAATATTVNWDWHQVTTEELLSTHSFLNDGSDRHQSTHYFVHQLKDGEFMIVPQTITCNYRLPPERFSITPCLNNTLPQPTQLVLQMRTTLLTEQYMPSQAPHFVYFRNPSDHMLYKSGPLTISFGDITRHMNTERGLKKEQLFEIKPIYSMTIQEYFRFRPLDQYELCDLEDVIQNLQPNKYVIFSSDRRDRAYIVYFCSQTNQICESNSLSYDLGTIHTFMQTTMRCTHSSS